jgi:hypothetical protein
MARPYELRPMDWRKFRVFLFQGKKIASLFSLKSNRATDTEMCETTLRSPLDWFLGA